MNSDDIFKKLIHGAKFNFKKFDSDAQKFKVNLNSKQNKDENENENENEDEDDLSDDSINNNQSENKKEKKKKQKTSKQLIKLHKEKIAHIRNVNKIIVNGCDVPDPIESFKELKINNILLNNIESNGYTVPTPIQMQAIPLMLDQRELIGCAPTGSGKTLAFLIPILNQLKTPQKSGFRAVILAPTRELAKQIHREALWISNGTGLRIHIIKNVNLAIKKFGQKSTLKYDILVTTPNRLAYLLKQEPPGVNIKNIEWLVIDECDKLFESEFRDQLSIIYNACNESSKVRHAMFSATFDPKLENWAKMNLDNIVTVIVGGKNKATQMVDQSLMFVGNEQGKIIALRNLIMTGCQPPVLIFVETIEKAKELFNELLYDGVNIDIINSERTQLQRDNVVRAFREGKVWFLICTELMGRGIDFKGVNLVINYDFPQSAISYIHRIGRTGRAGRPGKAITFFSEEDSEKLRSIANVIKQSGCHVPEFMLNIGKEKKKKNLKRKKKIESGIKNKLLKKEIDKKVKLITGK